MSCDLERIYGTLAARLPQNLDQDEPFALDESVIPAAPSEMSTDRLLIYRGYLQRLPGCHGDKLDIVYAKARVSPAGATCAGGSFSRGAPWVRAPAGYAARFSSL